MLRSVIVIDDSDADRYIIRRILERAQVAAKVHFFPSAIDALEYLDGRERFVDENGPFPPPALILLDINMPRMNGFEMLEELHRRVEEGSFCDDWVAAVMLTSSDEARDREEVRRYPKVVEYVVKPLDVETAVRLAKDVEAIGQA